MKSAIETLKIVEESHWSIEIFEIGSKTSLSHWKLLNKAIAPLKFLRLLKKRHWILEESHETIEIFEQPHRAIENYWRKLLNHWKLWDCLKAPLRYENRRRKPLNFWDWLKNAVEPLKIIEEMHWTIVIFEIAWKASSTNWKLLKKDSEPLKILRVFEKRHWAIENRWGKPWNHDLNWSGWNIWGTVKSTTIQYRTFLHTI